MDRLLWMQCYARALETGSFSAVARELATTQPSISKHIAALEDHLGVRLLHRSTRRLSPTPEGEIYYQACRRLLDQLSEAETHVRNRVGGLLRVGCPSALAQHRVLALVADFLQMHPDICLDVVHYEGDLIEGGLDLAFRFGALPDSAYKARLVGQYALACMATSDYVAKHGTPAHPDDLLKHNCIGFTPGSWPNVWTFRDHPLVPQGNLRVDSLEGLRAAALADVGIVVAPTWLFPHGLFDDNQLLCLLEPWPIQAVPVSILYPEKRLLPERAKRFMDFIAARFAEDPCLNGEAVEELGLLSCIRAQREAAA
jgi:DNA-binding transcriptional LysR family regulator